MTFDLHALVSGILIAFALLGGFALASRESEFGPRRIARLGVLLSMALVCAILEGFIPGIILPGMRLGLANVVLLFVLYVYGFKDGLLLAVLKAVLAGALRGSLFSMGGYMALMGTLLSFFGMALLHYTIRRLSVIGVSIAGALLHVCGQILVAYWFLGEAILGYLPWLLLFAFASGTLVGILVHVLLKRERLVAYLKK